MENTRHGGIVTTGCFGGLGGRVFGVEWALNAVRRDKLATERTDDKMTRMADGSDGSDGSDSREAWQLKTDCANARGQQTRRQTMPENAIPDSKPRQGAWGGGGQQCKGMGNKVGLE